MSVSAGIDMARIRLGRRGIRAACALALLFDLGVALLERAQGRVGAADRALMGGAFGVALPLLCYFLVGQVTAGTSLREALLPLSRQGLDRRSLTVGLALPAALVAGAFGAVSSLLVVLVTRGVGDPRLLADAGTSAWIGVVAGFCYVLAFVGASAWGRGGRGRTWLLLADFLLGAGKSLLAVPWPKGHVRNLLGGTPVLELSWFVALAALFGTSLAFMWLGTLRNGR